MEQKICYALFSMSNVFTSDVHPKISRLISILLLLFFLPFLILGTFQLAQLVSRASEKPAVITIDTQFTAEPISTNFYHAFSQGGEESADMIAPIAPFVTALNPRYIRLDHLYDHYNVVKRNGGELVFDFSRLDAVISTIRSTGATPVLALSYMPTAIAHEGVIINPPDNWDDWALVVQKTIEHYSGKNEQNISGIFYEVWNEPDLAQFGSWKIGGDKDYLTLYRYAAQGAANAQNVNFFSLGGPVTTGLYKTWITALVASGSRLDFFSWHSYLPNPDQYVQDQDNLISWLTDTPAFIAKPKLITEFGFTGEKSPAYGTMYAAAHSAAVIQKLAGRGVTALFSFELKDGPGQEAGDGWGLVTHESNGAKQKPRYALYNFLDPIAGTKLVHTGGNSFVSALATKQNERIAVLLVNFDNSGNHSEVTTVNFTKLINGSYTYRQHFLRGQDVTLTEAVSENTLTKSILMPAQSVAVIELTKK